MHDGSSAAACASGEWDGPPKKFALCWQEQLKRTPNRQQALGYPASAVSK